MKFKVITILTFGLLSCKNSVDNETEKDSLVRIDKIYTDNIEINGGSEDKELFECDFDKFVNDPETPKLAKDIYVSS